MTPQGRLAECRHRSAASRDTCHWPLAAIQQYQQQRNAVRRQMEKQLLQLLEPYTPALPMRISHLAAQLCKQLACLRVLREDVQVLDEHQRHMQRLLLRAEAIASARQAARTSSALRLLRQQQQRQACDLGTLEQMRQLLQREAQDLQQLQRRLVLAQKDLLLHRHLKKHLLQNDICFSETPESNEQDVLYLRCLLCGEPIFAADTACSCQYSFACRDTSHKQSYGRVSGCMNAATLQCATCATLPRMNSTMTAATEAAKEIQKGDPRTSAATEPAASGTAPALHGSAASPAAVVTAKVLERRAATSVDARAATTGETTEASTPETSVEPATGVSLAFAVAEGVTVSKDRDLLGTNTTAKGFGVQQAQHLPKIPAKSRHCGPALTDALQHTGCSSCCTTAWINELNNCLQTQMGQLTQNPRDRSSCGRSKDSSDRCSTRGYRRNPSKVKTSRVPHKVGVCSVTKPHTVARIISSADDGGSDSKISCGQSSRTGRNQSGCAGQLEEEEELFELQAEIEALEHELPALEHLQDEALRAAQYAYTKLYIAGKTNYYPSWDPVLQHLERRGPERRQSQLQEQQRTQEQQRPRQLLQVGQRRDKSRIPSRLVMDNLKERAVPGVSLQQGDQRLLPPKSKAFSGSTTPIFWEQQASERASEDKTEEQAKRQKPTDVEAKRRSYGGITSDSPSSSTQGRNKSRKDKTALSSKERCNNTTCIPLHALNTCATPAPAAAKVPPVGYRSPPVKSRCSAACRTTPVEEGATICQPGAAVQTGRTPRRSSAATVGVSAADCDSTRTRDGNVESTKGVPRLSMQCRESHRKHRARTQTMQQQKRYCSAKRATQQRGYALRAAASPILQCRKCLSCPGRQQHLPQKAPVCQFEPRLCNAVAQEPRLVQQPQKEQAHAQLQLRIKKPMELEKKQQHWHLQPAHQGKRPHHPQRLGAALFKGASGSLFSAEVLSKATAAEALGRGQALPGRVPRTDATASKLAACRQPEASAQRQRQYGSKGTTRRSETKLQGLRLQQRQQHKQQRQHMCERKATYVPYHRHEQQRKQKQQAAGTKQQSAELQQPHTDGQRLHLQQMHEHRQVLQQQQPQQDEHSGIPFRGTLSPLSCSLSSHSLFLHWSTSSCSSLVDDTA